LVVRRERAPKSDTLFKVYAEAKTFSAPSAWQIDVGRNVEQCDKKQKQKN
jgi:hypothetical protein